jgi:lipoprotein-releasing system ATP-binding protein
MSDGGSTNVLVEVVGLEKRYIDGPREVEVLRGLDLQVDAGEMVAVVGASGVGKSTLLHILGALDQPSGGSVRVAGVDPFTHSAGDLAAFRNRTMGFVFQFHQLLPDFTALENVMMAGLIGREPRAAVRGHATALLERVGLGARLDHRPGELSGGEQQRVAVARAMLRRPRLLLADEPTGNLDPETGLQVQEILLELNRECGAALVVATHNERLAGAMGRVVRLQNGRLEGTSGPEPVRAVGEGDG